MCLRALGGGTDWANWQWNPGGNQRGLSVNRELGGDAVPRGEWSTVLGGWWPEGSIQNTNVQPEDAASQAHSLQGPLTRLQLSFLEQFQATCMPLQFLRVPLVNGHPCTYSSMSVRSLRGKSHVCFYHYYISSASHSAWHTDGQQGVYE